MRGGRDGPDRPAQASPGYCIRSFAKPFGVWVGTVLGVAAAAPIAFSGPIFGMDPITGEDPVSFMWVVPAALAVDLSAGTLVSYWQHRRRGESVAL